VKKLKAESPGPDRGARARAGSKLKVWKRWKRKQRR